MLEEARYAVENVKHPCDWDNWGSSAAFLKLNPIWGVKVYRVEEDRDISHKIQALAATHTLAPAVGPVFEAQTRWGWPGHKSYCMLTIVADQSRGIPGYACREIEKKLERVGIRNLDVRKCNLGWLGNRIVCIDFDCCVTKPKPAKYL